MPVTKTAKKALRNSDRKKVRNLRERRKYKLVVKNFVDKSEKDLNKVFSAIDTASKKKLIHKKKANRIKSQISKSLNKTKKS